MSRYDEAGSSNSDSGFRNGVNRSLDRHSLSVKRATDSTRGTTPAIGNFHRIHPFFRVPSFSFSIFFFTDDDDWKKKMLESILRSRVLPIPFSGLWYLPQCLLGII